jgi:hypothetical protein
LYSAKQVRWRGWVLVVLGLLLVVLMGVVTLNVAPNMLHPGVPASDRSVYNGTKEEAQQVLGLFGLVILFGITCIVSGIWQIKSGRHNKKIIYFGIGLVIVLALVGRLIISQ